MSVSPSNNLLPVYGRRRRTRSTPQSSLYYCSALKFPLERTLFYLPLFMPIQSRELIPAQTVTPNTMYDGPAKEFNVVFSRTSDTPVVYACGRAYRVAFIIYARTYNTRVNRKIKADRNEVTRTRYNSK